MIMRSEDFDRYFACLSGEHGETGPIAESEAQQQQKFYDYVLNGPNLALAILGSTICYVFYNALIDVDAGADPNYKIIRTTATMSGGLAAAVVSMFGYERLNRLLSGPGTERKKLGLGVTALFAVAAGWGIAHFAHELLMAYPARDQSVMQLESPGILMPN